MYRTCREWEDLVENLTGLFHLQKVVKVCCQLFVFASVCVSLCLCVCYLECEPGVISFKNTCRILLTTLVLSVIVEDILSINTEQRSSN